MPRCRYCGAEIAFHSTSRGYRPVNPDGTLHHRTCRKFHELKARQRAERASLPLPVPVPEENPNQMHFAF